MDEIEKKIWDEGFSLIYDTSSLLDFYGIPIYTRSNIYQKIFDKIDQEFWLPGHVITEFVNNRKRVITKLIKDKYVPIRDSLASIEKNLESIQNIYKDIHNKTKNEDRHPYLDSDIAAKYPDIIERIKENISDFNDKIREELEKAENQIEETITNDDHLKAIEKYFNIDEDYNFSKIMEIVKEGESRYENEIPPGYKDRDEKSKSGFQIYGDLIIWKQILEYTSKNNCHIIFVIDDEKEDWFKYFDSEKYIPRQELLLEFKEHSDKNIWFYNQSTFLKAANEILESNAQEDIETVEEHMKEKREDFDELPDAIDDYLKRQMHINDIVILEYSKAPVFRYAIPTVKKEHIEENLLVDVISSTLEGAKIEMRKKLKGMELGT